MRSRRLAGATGPSKPTERSCPVARLRSAGVTGPCYPKVARRKVTSRGKRGEPRASQPSTHRLGSHRGRQAAKIVDQSLDPGRNRSTRAAAPGGTRPPDQHAAPRPQRDLVHGSVHGSRVTAEQWRRGRGQRRLHVGIGQIRHDARKGDNAGRSARRQRRGTGPHSGVGAAVVIRPCDGHRAGRVQPIVVLVGDQAAGAAKPDGSGEGTVASGLGRGCIGSPGVDLGPIDESDIHPTTVGTGRTRPGRAHHLAVGSARAGVAAIEDGLAGGQSGVAPKARGGISPGVGRIGRAGVCQTGIGTVSPGLRVRRHRALVGGRITGEVGRDIGPGTQVRPFITRVAQAGHQGAGHASIRLARAGVAAIRRAKAVADLVSMVSHPAASAIAASAEQDCQCRDPQYGLGHGGHPGKVCTTIRTAKPSRVWAPAPLPSRISEGTSWPESR